MKILGYGKCKGPEMEGCLPCSRIWGPAGWLSQGESSQRRSHSALQVLKDLHFYFEQDEIHGGVFEEWHGLILTGPTSIWVEVDLSDQKGKQRA